MRKQPFGFLIDIFKDAKAIFLSILVVITILGIITGYRYYRFTQEDPQFCNSCHLMKEAFLTWQKGAHRDIVCQRCHQLTLLEQNQLLISYVVKGSNTRFSGTHGRKKPWQACRKCHIEEVSQGAITLRESYGHARHVFMQNIDCKVCHGGSLHDFKPKEKACYSCHPDKRLHGMGMAGFSCLNCHSFGEKTQKMTARDKCLRCHSISVNTPMGTLECYSCHKPHGRMKPTEKDCLGECHGNETAVGQHAKHMKKGLTCFDCHKAHTWTVGKKEARNLCNRCHPARDPKTFIY